MSLGLIAFLAFILVPLIWGISLYNQLITLRNRYKNAFAQIDVQLKRRYDLIPNLVETAKAYLKHEAGTLEAVIQARNQAMAARQVASAAVQDAGDASAMAQLSQAEGALSSSLGRLFALSESYPDLKANTTIEQLNEELSSTENKIAFSRQAYNDCVMDYNTGIEQFPASILTAMFAFKPAELLQAIEADVERKPVAVKL